MVCTKKNNAERIAQSELQYNGRNTYWDEPWAAAKNKATLQVRGIIFTYKPKEAIK